MQKYSLILILFIIFITGDLFSQVIDTNKIVRDTTRISGDTTNLNSERQEEKLLENFQDDVEDSKLLDLLDYLESNPYELNTVTQEELVQIPFLNSILVSNIMKYRQSVGGFKTKKDLLSVEGMTQNIYDDIKIYVYIRNSKYDYIQFDDGKTLKEGYRNKTNLIKNLDIRYRTRFQQQLQPSAGYLNGDYLGPRYKVYNNLRATYNNSKYSLEGNLIFEKDPGETDWNDFTTGYVELRDYSFIKEAIVGDYSLGFGQGLAMWSSLGFSKGSESVSTTNKSGIGVKSYTSTNESQFFRGGAAQMRLGKFDVIAFVSSNYYDASIDTTLNEVSSFYFDGYHRTITERNKANSVKENIFGSRAVYSYNSIRLGATYWTSNFSKPFSTDSIRQLFSFTGDKANMLGFDYDIVVKNMNIYGEFARSQSGSIAGIGAVEFAFLDIGNLVFLYRDYPIDFAPIHSFGFGEKNGNTQNERGLYTGISLKPLKGLSINAYYDQFKFPYRSYFEPVPLTGNDFLTFVEWQVNKSLYTSFRFKNKNVEESITITDEFGRDIKEVATKNQMNIRVGFEYEISNNIMVKSRYDYVYVSYNQFGTNEKGNMFYSDVRFIPVNGLSVSFRLAFFSSDGWNSRLYEYEADIKGVMSNYALYGQGSRWYIMTNWRPFNSAELSAKYSVTYKEGVTSMGTGNDMINGNMDNRLNLMLELLF